MGRTGGGAGQPEVVRILDVPISRMSTRETVEWLTERVEGRAPLPAGGPCQVVTPNPEIIWAAQQDRELMQVLKEACLAVPDGTGVVWAARRLGEPVPERVTGIDLLRALLERSAARGWRVYFLGTRPDVIEAAVDRIRESLPDLQVVGSHHGYFKEEETPRILAKIAASGAELLFTGMGAERDLKWTYRHRQELTVRVAVGVGGSFDVLAGRVARAPRWMQQAGLEWLFRLLQEPRRWRRVTALPRFAWAVWRQSRN